MKSTYWWFYCLVVFICLFLHLFGQLVWPANISYWEWGRSASKYLWWIIVTHQVYWRHRDHDSWLDSTFRPPKLWLYTYCQSLSSLHSSHCCLHPDQCWPCLVAFRSSFLAFFYLSISLLWKDGEAWWRWFCRGLPWPWQVTVHPSSPGRAALPWVLGSRYMAGEAQSIGFANEHQFLFAWLGDNSMDMPWYVHFISFWHGPKPWHSHILATTKMTKLEPLMCMTIQLVTSHGAMTMSLGWGCCIFSEATMYVEMAISCSYHCPIDKKRLASQKPDRGIDA